MDVSWEDIRLFLAVADFGSLTEAARRLRIGQPTVSRRLAELEERLGYSLFHRSVEGAALTSQGEKLVEPARRMAEWAGELEHAAEQASASPTGVVRITAPPGIAYDFVAPFAARVSEKLPGIRLQVLSRTEYLDLARREADLALRMRLPTQRDLVRVATLEHANDAFATPDYLARLPPNPSLAQIGFVGWAPPFEDLTPNRELAAIIPDFRPSFASDDFIVQGRAAEAGAGAVFMAKLTHRFSRPSPLVPLGLDLGPHSRSQTHVVAAKSALGVARIRAVADLLVEEFQWAAAHSKNATCH
jgi:DNA-binding transcriptional LysR family regulator